MTNHNPSALDQHLGYWLRCLSNYISGSFAARLDRHGVSVAQWVVLRTLYDLDSVTLVDAAKLIGVDKSSLSRMMERLEDKKLVVRAANAKDGRSAYLKLSPAGRKLVPVLAREADENDAVFFETLSNTQKKQLEQIVKNLLSANGWAVSRRGQDRME